MNFLRLTIQWKLYSNIMYSEKHYTNRFEWIKK